MKSAKTPLLGNFSRVNTEAGIDEAGRGCLAGPVFAAAVILPEEFDHPILNDSKKLSADKRFMLKEIIEKESLSWSVGRAEVQEIDQINILQATFLAMHRAISGLIVKPGFLLIDGNRFRTIDDIPYKTVVGGDGLYKSIAAASILAKTHRDKYMESIHDIFPDFHWNENKGYGTEKHRRAIIEFGATLHHRKSFTLIGSQSN